VVRVRVKAVDDSFLVANLHTNVQWYTKLPFMKVTQNGTDLLHTRQQVLHSTNNLLSSQQLHSLTRVGV